MRASGGSRAGCPGVPRDEMRPDAGVQDEPVPDEPPPRPIPARMVRPPARLPGRWPGGRDLTRDLALVPAAAVTALAIQVFSVDPAEWIVDLPEAAAVAFCAVPDGRDGMPILLGLLTLGPVLGLIGLAGFGRPHSWFGLVLGAGLAAYWLQRFVLHVPACTP
ncbi:hypothetical protein ACLBX9_24935 [Methylobacterium sp. A49B]